MADKTVRLVSGEDVLYPKTLVTNILNEDGTQWEPSSGGGSGVETLVLNEADSTTIMNLMNLEDSNIPTKGHLTGSYELKSYGLIQCTAEGMTTNFQVSGGMNMASMIDLLEIMIIDGNAILLISLGYSAMDSNSYWNYERKVCTLTSAS